MPLDFIRLLILDERLREGNRFLQGVDLEPYLAKLGARAEIISDSVGGRCRGFVAFYCNDQTTKQAFISMVLVDVSDRGIGIGRALVTCVLVLAKHRGFTSCRLEVDQQNVVACRMYADLGFRLIECRGLKDLMEVAL